MTDNVVPLSPGTAIFASETGLEEAAFSALCQDVSQLRWGPEASVVASLAADKHTGARLGYGVSVVAEALHATYDSRDVHLIQAGRRRVLFADLEAVAQYLSARGVVRFEVDVSR